MSDSKKSYKVDLLMSNDYWTHWSTYCYKDMAIEVAESMVDNKEVTDFRIIEIKEK